MFTIDKGVPVKGEFRTRYPFAEMDPNDSFIVTCPPEKKKVQAANLSASARRFREHYPGRRFAAPGDRRGALLAGGMIPCTSPTSS